MVCLVHRGTAHTNHGVRVKAGVDVGVLTLMLFPVRLLRNQIMAYMVAEIKRHGPH